MPDSLKAISPVDGRYYSKVKELSEYFSEAAIIRYRIAVEVEYFIRLAELPLPQLKDFPRRLFPGLRALYQDFKDSYAQRVKEIEATTNHDVKAVEYFIAEHFIRLGVEKYTGFIHFGLTSQDINNTAFPWAMKDAFSKHYLPLLEDIITRLKTFATEWKDIPMLSRTHGQPASPTLVGKEFYVFAERLETQLDNINKIPFNAKFGGAVGNFNAHHVAYPDIDWIDFANNFILSLGMERLQTTTQIEHYDNLGLRFKTMAGINTILIDLARDIWTYISMEYFKQKVVKGETGSSTMPHKINPIDFENAEGNFGVANALFDHLANKLPVSRLQRDLTDSTVLRNVGMPFAYTLIAFKSLMKGLDKLLINEEKIKQDLDNHWEITAEAIQTILRREMIPNAYELLKDLTRKNEKVTPETLRQFIDNLPVSDSVKDELKQITPFNYTGIFDINK